MTKQYFQSRRQANKRAVVVDRWIHLHLGKHEPCQVTSGCPGIAGFQMWAYREDFVTWEQLAARQKEDAPYRISIKLSCEACLKALFCEMTGCDERIAQQFINALKEFPGKRSAVSFRYGDALDTSMLCFCHNPSILGCMREIIETAKPLAYI